MMFAGLLLLTLGSGFFVKGARQIATICGVSPLVIGIVLVGLGTSFPEWVVSLLAALKGSSSVSIGNAILNVFLTPGHTPGHIIFFHAPSKLAIVGDVLFAGSIGRTDLPGGNYEQLIESIKTKLWPLGEDIAFVPGHGPPSNFKTERSTNPFVSDSNL